jgi:hypothetical protein
MAVVTLEQTESPPAAPRTEAGWPRRGSGGDRGWIAGPALAALAAVLAVVGWQTLAANGDVGARALATYWVGQGVGLMNRVKPARQVVYEFAQDYLEAAERLANSLGD